jgi:hypothetical protein
VIWFGPLFQNEAVFSWKVAELLVPEFGPKKIYVRNSRAGATIRQKRPQLFGCGLLGLEN